MSHRNRQAFLAGIIIILFLVGIILIMLQSEIAVAIGTSILASGFVAVLEIVRQALTADDMRLANHVREVGLRDIFNRRDLERYHELVPVASSRLDICGYSLRAFHDSFGPTLLSTAKNNRNFRARLLLVDPSTDISKQREKVEKLAEGTFDKAYNNMRAYYLNCPNIEIGLISMPLTSMIFRIDKIMFVGPQLLSVVSKATPTLELEFTGDTSQFHLYEKEFDALWESRHTFEEREE